MSEQNNKATTTEVSLSWIAEAGTKVSSSDRVNHLKDYTLLKVYNPNMGQTPDPELDGKIVERTEDGWRPFESTLEEIEVLDLVKCYAGYAARMENGTPVKDENGKVINDLYFTPEVSVYDKSNIALAKSTEQGPVVLGKGGFKGFLDFTTSVQLPDGTVNPLFSSINTNTQTGEKYPVSVMKQEVYLYLRKDSKLYKLKLGASYGRWKDVKKGTFLSAKNDGINAFKSAHPNLRFEHHYLTITGTVKAADKYKYIDWQFANITKESIVDDLDKTQQAIVDFNNSRFPGIAVGNGMEVLPYDMNRLMLTTSEKVEEIVEGEVVKESDISVDDLPF